MRVLKRDGSYEKFKREKITRAILIAAHRVGESINLDLDGLVDCIVGHLHGNDPVDEINNIVEGVLVEFGYRKVAGHFNHYRHQRNVDRGRRLEGDNEIIATYTHHAKYGGAESFEETVARNAGMHLDRWPQFSDQIHEAYSKVYDRKVLPSMRSMQFAGPAILANNARMYNCAYTPVNRLRVFDQTL